MKIIINEGYEEYGEDLQCKDCKHHKLVLHEIAEVQEDGILHPYYPKSLCTISSELVGFNEKGVCNHFQEE